MPRCFSSIYPIYIFLGSICNQKEKTYGVQANFEKALVLKYSTLNAIQVQHQWKRAFIVPKTTRKRRICMSGRQFCIEQDKNPTICNNMLYSKNIILNVIIQEPNNKYWMSLLEWNLKMQTHKPAEDCYKRLETAWKGRSLSVSRKICFQNIKFWLVWWLIMVVNLATL